MSLDRLTIVIPTYERRAYLERSLRHWSKASVRVLILDGSREAINEEDVAGFGERVEYHHLPIPFSERLGKAADFIQTEYTSLVADDEFHLFSALERSLETLDEDPSLVACIGRCLGFRGGEESIVSLSVYPRFRGYENRAEDPGERMVFHFENYLPSTIYGVVRSPAWQSAVRVIAEKEFPVFALPELQFEMLIAFQGKTRVIPELHWLRSFDAPPVRDTDVSLVETNGFDTWWRNDEKVAERSEFLEIMATGMQTVFGHSPDWLKDRITAALDGYLDVFLPAYREFLAARGGDSFQPLKEGVEELESEGVRVDQGQLTAVADLLRDFHPVISGEGEETA